MRAQHLAVTFVLTKAVQNTACIPALAAVQLIAIPLRYNPGGTLSSAWMQRRLGIVRERIILHRSRQTAAGYLVCADARVASRR